MTTAAKIKHHRLAAGLTQADLAVRMGTSQGQVGRLEQSHRRLTDDWVERIAKALGIDPANFVIDGNTAPGSTTETSLAPVMERIADALDRMSPPVAGKSDLDDGTAFVWHADGAWLESIERVNRIDYGLLKGIDHQSDILLDNTLNFARGLPANNALLWGARGTGKSSLVKAVHSRVIEGLDDTLVLVEIHREDIPSLPRLLTLLRGQKQRCLLFCDDLSFEGSDASFKSLKAVLDGGIEGRPENVLFYATSNRRHLMARDMIENERSTAINPSEAVEEKVSLSDRFGLWLGFHNHDQETYFAIIEGYANHFGLNDPAIDLCAEANEWSVTRGARSGRVAWQYIQDLAGRLGKPLT